MPRRPDRLLGRSRTSKTPTKKVTERDPPQRRGRRLFLLGGLGFAACVVALIAVFLWVSQWWVHDGPLGEPRVLVVAHGGVKAIGRQLADAGIIDDPLRFAIAARLTGASTSLKAGEYLFPASISPSGVATLLDSGRTIVHRLVVPEGWTVAEAVAMVTAAPAAIGQISRVPAEGRLRPETYFYSYGEDRQALIDRMRRSMTQQLDQLWAARAPGMPLKSADQALTLASIVEKETAIPAERPRIASVFYNRLRLGMPLQSDPTVNYALTNGQHPLDRPLLHADLAVNSPYNTYQHPGLPPGPIANPGEASLQAVLHPEASNALYFVADGSGGHSFSATLEQHNRNVEQWRRLQAQNKADAQARSQTPATRRP